MFGRFDTRKDTLTDMNILFICSGNSVRSQIAEGWARHLAADGLGVTSAGLRALGVHPRAVATMRQAGVDISGHGSRTIDDALLHWPDHIVTLCDSVKPFAVVFPPTAAHHHWSIPDPDKPRQGESAEEAYDRVRDQIRMLVEQLLQELQRR